LRLVLGEQQFRLQFWALLPGPVWFVPYWLRHRRNWDWNQRLPMLLLVSLLTAAYGAWPFDLVLLLLPVMQRASQIQRAGRIPLGLWALFLYLVFNSVAALQLAWQVEYLGFIWMTPILFLVYAALGRRLHANSP